MVYKLKDIVTIKYGKNQKDVIDDNGEYPILGTGGIMGFTNKYLYDKSSVLIGRKGNIDKVQYINKPFWTIDTLFYTEINEDIIIPKYLYYKLKEIDFKSMNEGTTIPSLRTQTLYEIELDIDELEVQKKIVKILDDIDRKLELNNQINDNLYEVCKRMFKEWFVNYNYPNNIGNLKESSLGSIPYNWEICEIQDITKIKRGASPRPIQNYLSEQGINWLKIADVTRINEPFIYSIKEKIIEAGRGKSNFITAGTLVVSNSATPGIPKFVEVDTCVHDGWLILTGYREYYKYFLYFLILNIREKLLCMANGSVFQNLKTDILKEYKFVNPDLKTLEEFHYEVKMIMKKIQNNMKENGTLTQLRDTLLQKLMNREIDLDKIEI